MIKAVVFDLGGILYTTGTEQFAQAVAQRHNLDYDYVHWVIDKGDLGTLYREGRMTRDEFWHAVEEKLHTNENIDDLEKEWVNEYKLVESVRDMVIKLSQNYKVFYLSGNVKERVDILNAKYDFIKLFNDGIFSHEVGIRKPDIRIYQLAMRKFDVKPDEVVFIDDKQEYMPPAENMGMTTILYKSPEQLQEELTKLHLLGFYTSEESEKEYVDQEVKVINVDVEKLRKKLDELGATCVFDGNRVFTYFDYEDNKLQNNNEEVRLTEEGRLKLNYSQRIPDGRKETIKVFVSRKKEIVDFLNRLKLKPTAEITSYRISYEWGTTDFDIDIFPDIPAFIEIDLGDVPKMQLQELLKYLELEGKEMADFSTNDVYKNAGINIFEKFKI